MLTTSPRMPTSGCASSARLEDRHPGFDDFRGGDQQVPELDPTAEPLGQGLHPDVFCTPPGIRCEPSAAWVSSPLPYLNSSSESAHLTLLVNPFYWLLTAAWFTGRFHVIQEIFPPAVFYMGLAGLIIGNTTFTIVAVAGCYSRSNHEDVKWALLSPVYWVLLSVGAWKGLLQLFYKPYYWEKTTHGYCLIDSESSSDDGQLVGPGAEVAS